MSYQLKLDRSELYAAMKPVFRGFKASELSQFILSYDGTHLHISTEVSRCQVKADGEWSGTVFVRHRGPFMKAIRHLPKVPTVVLRAEGNSLSVAGTHMQCRCEETLKRHDREKVASSAGRSIQQKPPEPLPQDAPAKTDIADIVELNVEAWLESLARNGESARLAEIAQLASALTAKSLKGKN